MRTAFVKTLMQLAAQDERIWLVNGDLGYKVLDEFKEKFSKRYINAGVAEQNMIGISAGLALSGKIVFVYSIANFPTFRCLEQIRNDICYHNANVKIISVGAGYTYGSHGYTHHGIEDMAIMRILPNMKVISPGDPIEAGAATAAAHMIGGPVYIRLGKSGEPLLHQNYDLQLDIGKSIPVTEGNSLTIFATGGVLGPAIEATKILAEKKIYANLISVPWIKPIDEDAIQKAIYTNGKIVTVEEHGIGGLATCVAEVIARTGKATKFSPIYINDEITFRAGSQTEMRNWQGLYSENIARVAMSIAT